ncbi:Cation transporting P-ATPase [Durusdinium trenchii]|uniref:Putative n=1 Tax=Durusdinium trenchii TaxID=1381693 RepID=A0ABP0I1N8_9DINO
MPKSGLRVAFEVDECDERLGGESAEGEVLQKVKRRERKAQTFDPSKVARAKDEAAPRPERLPFPLRAREAPKAPTETLATLAPKRYTVATEKVTTLEEELKTRPTGCGVLGARRRQSASLFGEAVRCAEKAAALQRALQRVHGAGAGAVLGGAWQRKWLQLGSELEVGLNRLELTGSSAETLLKVLEHHGWTSDPLEDGSGHFSGDNPPDLSGQKNGKKNGQKNGKKSGRKNGKKSGQKNGGPARPRSARCVAAHDTPS